MRKENLRFHLVFLFALILGILSDYLFYGKPIGISFFVFILILVTFSLILSRYFKKKVTKTQVFLLIPAAFFASMVFLRSSLVLNFLNILGAFYLLLFFFSQRFFKKLSDFEITDYLKYPFSLIKKSFQDSKPFIKEKIDLSTLKKKPSPEFISVLKGLGISLPILVILILLLSSADIVFQKYLDQLIGIRIDIDFWEVLKRLSIVFGMFYFFTGLFSFVFVKKKSEPSLPETEKGTLAFLGRVESMVILISVGLLFLIFIIIQFLYLFGGEQNIGVHGFTYAEYARRGFFELIGVAAISFLLVYGLERFAKRGSLGQNRWLKILNSILIFEVFIIMTSAFKRLSLYEDAYGFTVLRLYTHIFIVWLFFVLLFFAFKIIFEKRESRFVFSVFLLSILFWASINILSPDAFIARKNIKRHTQGKELDTWYLSTLSEDAIPEIVKIFRMEVDDETKTKIAYDLDWHCTYNYLTLDKDTSIQEKLEKIKEGQKWQSFNLLKREAFESLRKHSQEIDKYKKIYEERLKSDKIPSLPLETPQIRPLKTETLKGTLKNEILKK